MNLNDLRLERLSSPLGDIQFDCSDEDLNEFFLQDSIKYQEQLLAVTYIFRNRKSNEVVAYFSVANEGIEADNRTKKEIPREKRHRKIPAVLIARLAVSKSYQKTGFGSSILAFIKYLFILKNKTGCRYLVADAYNKPEVISFYKKNGFDFLGEYDSERRAVPMKFDLKPFEMQMKKLKLLS